MISFLALLHEGADPGVGLLKVGDDVAVGQDRALGLAGRPPGVLEEGDVFMSQFHRLQAMAPASRQGIAEAHRAVEAPGRDHLLHPADDEIDQHRLRETQHLPEAGDHHVLHRYLRAHLLERMGEILDDDDGVCARILQLVFEFPRGVYRGLTLTTV